jgi:phosphohistidine phosphatase SixA
MTYKAFRQAMPLVAAMMVLGGAARAEHPIEAEDIPWPVGTESLAAREPPRQPDAVVSWSSLEPAELVKALRSGGLVLFVRHGQAVGSDRDPAPWRLPGDRQAQGRLTPVGMDQARMLGDGVRTLGIPVAKVVASPYVRARDFAEIAFRTKPVIAVDLGPENPGQLDAYRRYVVAPPTGGNLVVVGHLLAPTTASISQLRDLADGHTAVWRADGKGGQTLIALIAPGDWRRLAAALNHG